MYKLHLYTNNANKKEAVLSEGFFHILTRWQHDSLTDSLNILYHFLSQKSLKMFRIL